MSNNHYLYWLTFLYTAMVAISCGKNNNEHNINNSTDNRSNNKNRYVSVNDDIFVYDKILTITGADDEPASLLNDPNIVLKGPDDCYYVWDSGDNRIVIYNNDGIYDREINRVGNGPDEYQIISDIYIYNEKIHIRDRSRGRIVIYTIDGDYIDAVPYNVPGEQVVLMDNDTIITVREDMSVNGRNQFTSNNVIISRDDTIMCSFETESIMTHYNPRNTRGFWPIPYAEQSSVYIRSNKGILVSNGNAPELEWYDYNGTCFDIICLDINKEKIRRADYRSYNRYLRHWISIYPNGTAAKIIKTYKMNSHKPLWTTIYIDDAGYYWLYVPDIPQYQFEDWRYSKSYIVLSPEGEYIGTTTHPEAVTWTINKGYLSTVHYNKETEIREVVIYYIYLYNETRPYYEIHQFIHN